MDPKVRAQRIEALEKIKKKALEMAQKGIDSLEVRDFVNNAKKELAFELPDQEAFNKAMKATLAYKKKRKEEPTGQDRISAYQALTGGGSSANAGIGLGGRYSKQESPFDVLGKMANKVDGGRKPYSGDDIIKALASRKAL